MRLPLVVFVSLSTLGFSAEPPTVPKPAPKKIEDAPKPKILAPPAPTPAPKRSVLGRIFGSKPKPEPTPAPTPAPVAVKPKPKARPKPKAAEVAEPNSETPDAEASKTPPPKKKPEGETPDSEKPKPAVKPEAETPAPPEKPATETPTAEKPPGDAPATEDQPPKPGKNSKASKNAKNTPPKPAKPEVVLDDATKYKNAHAAALADEKIKDLKAKADNAVDDAEAHKASVAYNKALYRKIREIDGSLEGYVDKLEQAMMKRLEAEKH
jgi:hypothetical protein